MHINKINISWSRDLGLTHAAPSRANQFGVLNIPVNSFAHIGTSSPDSETNDNYTDVTSKVAVL